MPSLGGWEWVILALIALLLFGGSRLAGVGKNAGRAIRDFKDETAALRSGGTAEPGTPAAPAAPAAPVTGPAAPVVHPQATTPGPVTPAVPSPSPVDPDADKS